MYAVRKITYSLRYKTTEEQILLTDGTLQNSMAYLESMARIYDEKIYNTPNSSTVYARCEFKDDNNNKVLLDLVRVAENGRHILNNKKMKVRVKKDECFKRRVNSHLLSYVA